MRNTMESMKKFKIFLIFFCLGLSFIGADAQYSDFNPITGGGSRSSQSRKVPVQQTYGYVPTRNGWVRVSIRIQATQYGVVVVGYKDKDNVGYNQYYSSYGDGWNQCSASVESVSAFEDGQTAANNFDYKAYVSGLGTVYF